MRVKPSRPGLIVGYPGRSSPLNPGGEEVSRSAYWGRRLMKGDVVEVLEEPSTPDQATADPPESAAEEPSPAARPTRRKGAGRRADPDTES